MSIDKKKWQDIAEKYDTKAKWADALLMLNTDDHDDIISALIELDPKDLIAEDPRTNVVFKMTPTEISEAKAMVMAINRELGRGF